MTRSVIALAVLLAVAPHVGADFMLEFSGSRTGPLSGGVNYPDTGAGMVAHPGAQTNVDSIARSNITFEILGTHFMNSRLGTFPVREVGLPGNPGSKAWSAASPVSGFFGDNNLTELTGRNAILNSLKKSFGSGFPVPGESGSKFGQGANYRPGQFGDIQDMVSYYYPGQSAELGIQAAPAPGIIVLLSSGSLFVGLIGAARRKIGGRRG